MRALGLIVAGDGYAYVPYQNDDCNGDGSEDCTDGSYDDIAISDWHIGLHANPCEVPAFSDLGIITNADQGVVVTWATTEDGVSPTQSAAAFVEQSLADTEAAIRRLFQALPHVDTITVRVFDETSKAVIISGTVARPDTSARDEKLSIGMRLGYLGVTYHSAGSLFEALEGDYQSAPAPCAGGVLSFRTEESLVKAMYRRNLNTP